MIEEKIQKELCKQIEPLFEIWKSEAQWTDEEALVMFHKLFNADKPSEDEIHKFLVLEFGEKYRYYNARFINRIYRKARKKLNKILP